MNERKNPIRARDVMTDQFLKMDGLNTVAEALQAMHRENAGAVIINKRDDNDEHGIVLLVDIARKVLAADRAPDRVSLYQIMTKPAIGVHPEMDVRYIARLFDHFGLNQAPVISDGKVIGLVTYRDLVFNGLILSNTDE